MSPKTAMEKLASGAVEAEVKLHTFANHWWCDDGTFDYGSFCVSEASEDPDLRKVE